MPKFTAAHWGSYRVTEQGLVPVETDPQPADAGRAWLHTSQDASMRVARPAFRRGWLNGRDKDRSGDAQFVELPWDEALDIVADEVRRVIATHGNSAIYAGSYGWASAGRFHHAQSQLKRFLNCIGGYTYSKNTYSHAGGEVLWPHVIGSTNLDLVNSLTTWDQITDHCQLLVAFGGISPRTAQISSGGTSTHQLRAWLDRVRDGDCRLVNISPVAGDLEGAEWRSIRPGTDLALILALSHTILSRGLEDRDFLARCTVGSDRFRDSVMGVSDGVPKTPEWAAPICHIPAREIEALAVAMTQARTMLSMAWSLQRQDRGEAVIWAGLNLACLLGQVGQPGCGFGFGYGSMNTNGRPVRRWKWPSMPQGINPVTEFIPTARITDMLESPGQQYRYDGGTYTYPDARLVWWAGGNPFHHHQDLNRLARAWRNPETVIVNDFVWNATARRADIVLPCTSPLERDDLMLQSKDPVAIFMSRVLDPFGEARCDYDIFAGLASRMGVADAFTEGRSHDDWLRHLWAEAQRSAAARGVTLPDFDGFREIGWVDIPDSAFSETLFESFVRDPSAHPLKTPSGRIEMASATIGAMGIAELSDTPDWREPVEWLGRAQADELHLISPQPQHRLHGQNDASAEICSHKVRGRELCRLHPDTAAHRNLGEGDVAEIYNVRGACLAAVALDPDMRADCVALPTGAWLDVVEIDGRPVDVHGNPNVLTLDKGSSELSQGTSAHTALVQVRKWGSNLPPVTVFDGPRFER